MSSANSVIVCGVGHSIMFGIQTLGPTVRTPKPYMTKMLDNINSRAYVRSTNEMDLEVNGPVNQGITGLRVNALTVADCKAVTPHIVCLDIGSNDVFDAMPAATLMTNVASKVTAYLAFAQQVLVATILDRGDIDTTRRGIITSYNTLLRAGGAGDPTRVLVVDTTTNSNLTDYTNTTYVSVDQIHFTQLGYDQHALVWAPVLVQARGRLKL